LQAENDSSVVGMPADVVTIYKNGYKWSSSNKRCTIQATIYHLPQDKITMCK